MADARPVIVGIAPAEGYSRPFDPATRSGTMLLELAGAPSYRELQKSFRMTNLSHYPLILPRASRSKKRLSAYRAELGELARAFRIDPNASYILAGFEVRRAFGSRILPEEGRANLEPFTWWRSRIGPMVAILPHPSGMNRFYNSIDNRRLASQFLRECAFRKVEY